MRLRKIREPDELPENTDLWTFAEHAEAWTREQGKTVPGRDTPEWDQMYREWHAWAFRDFPD